MDMGGLVLFLHILVALWVCGSVIVPVASAYVAIRCTHDPRRIVQGFGAGTVLGWGVTAGLWRAIYHHPSDDLRWLPFVGGGAVAYGVAHAIARPDQPRSADPPEAADRGTGRES